MLATSVQLEAADACAERIEHPVLATGLAAFARFPARMK